jgi:ribonuclease PH
MNLVMTGTGKFIEVQATAEHQVYDDDQLQAMIGLGRAGITSLLETQQSVLGKLEVKSHSALASRTLRCSSSS